MRNITINGRFLDQRLTGVQRYAVETTKALLNQKKLNLYAHEDLAIDVHAPYVASKSGTVKHEIGARRGRYRGHFWEQFELPFSSAHCLINFCNTYPLFADEQIVVIHDASIYAMSGGYTAAFVRYYKFLYWCIRFKKKTIVVTDSEFSKNELCRYARLDPNKVSVIYCGSDHWHTVSPSDTVLKKFSLKKNKYFLAVASVNPNKNLGRLIDAYKKLNCSDVPLVLVGGTNDRVFAKFVSNDVRGIVRTGYISDQELAGLYQGSTAFVFPSLYEGFGLPPLEAMTFGCPVISSTEASLPEVCGNAALYCDAYSVDDIARAMSEILVNEKKRDALIVAGYEQVKKFTWRATAEGLLKLIQNRK